jgi:hypothetical protein
MARRADVEGGLKDLIKEGEAVLATKEEREYADFVDPGAMTRWESNALTLLRSAFGVESEQYSRAKSMSGGTRYSHAVAMHAMLQSALDYWVRGYVFDMRELVEAEVFSDFIEMAAKLLESGYYHAAAVLVGGVLEEHLRAMCARRAIPLETAQGKSKALGVMNDDLAKAAAYNAVKRRQITVWIGIRNKAAHGEWDDVAGDDVAGFLDGVRGFCADVA